MTKAFREPMLTHPCFSIGDKVNKGRVHLPVSPGCNICYCSCNRRINDVDIRPGVTSMIITPQEAVEVVRRAVKLYPDIAVAGIVGPGDTLATPYTLETFQLIKQEFPDIVECMSTSSLLLSEYAQEIIDVGIDTLTVAVNALDPGIQAQIRSGTVYHSRCYERVGAAKILVGNQLKRIEIVSEAGTTVKVNMVLTPEISADHIEAVTRTVAEAGARIYNIIPLIPRHELSWCSTPGCAVLNQARCGAEAYIDMFRHCQRCRADAVGIPRGKDFVRQIYTRPVVQQNTFSHG